MSVTPSPAGNGRPPQLVDLALQGGGSHGAFTWGVLDRLLEETWLQHRGHFRDLGRRHECRRAGRWLCRRRQPRARARRWKPSGAAFREAAVFSPLQRSPIDVLLGRWTLDHSPAFIAMDLMSRLVLAL